MKAQLCMTGHQLECHYPLACAEAGCGHLDRYDYDPEKVQGLRAAADLVFLARANSECGACGGSGFCKRLISLAEMRGFDPIQFPREAEMIRVLGPCDCLDPFDPSRPKFRVLKLLLDAYIYGPEPWETFAERFRELLQEGTS